MSREFYWPAPAKLNLFLHITGRRSDGYHLLQTVFQILDYGDDLRFEPREDGVINPRYHMDGVTPEMDLICRAARLLQTHTGSPLGADIYLHKRLPMGGGLGGGSSDAATVLVALNEIWQTGLSSDALAQLGVALGADVPVFVRGHSAWAEGVGEVLSPVELPESDFLVIVPPINVSTAEIFSDPELIRDTSAITIRDFLAGQMPGNSLQAVVEKRYPPVKQALEWLNDHARAQMTGSGACIFARFESRRQAEQVLGMMPRGWRGFVARGRNHSPLLAALEAYRAL